MTTNRMTAFVFATHREARPLLEQGQAMPVATGAAALPVYVLQLAGVRYLAAVSGMGSVAARHMTQQLIEHHSLASIVNVGIAGSLKTNLAVGDVFNIRKASSPPQSWSLAPAGQLVTGCADAELLSFDQPVFDARRRDLLSRQADLVDMEGAAIAGVCAGHALPCQLLKGISDFAAERAQLHRNLQAVSERLAARIIHSLTMPSMQRSCA